MDARRFLLLMAALFLGNAVLGLLLLRFMPHQASPVAVGSVLLLGAGVAVIAVRTPRMMESACGHCGHARDDSLPFCARCGVAPTAPSSAPRSS